ncbi:MAG: hypothetical protein WKF92_02685 [Pyrinomonadaceae bacterium]
MKSSKFRRLFILPTVAAASFILAGCGAQPGATNVNLTNSNSNLSNSFANASNINSVNTNSMTPSVVESREPEQYQATVKLILEAIGDTQKTAVPPLGAVVARNGADRAMEFTLPNNEKVIYIEKAGVNYVVLPNRKQYAELTKESVGFEVRRLLMPEQIVNQIKSLQGVRLVGEENMNGRTVIKYAYSGTANTQTQAGNVGTESVLLVDKETGLPLRSETVSQSNSGGNVQGYKGMRIVTEMSDIKTAPDAQIFNVPTDFQKIDSEQVKAQVGLIFNMAAAVIGQVMQQQAKPANPSPTVSPAM